MRHAMLATVILALLTACAVRVGGYSPRPFTTLAIKAPKHVRVGATINNHTDYRSTERAYNLANTMDAATAHLENLTALRRKFRR